MKVFIITSESIPNGMAATNRILCYAKGLKTNDVDCTILITHRTEKYNAIKNRLSCGNIDGVKYQYIPTSTIRSKYFIKRRIDDFFDSVKVFFKVLFSVGNEDKIVIYNVNYFILVSLLLLSKIIGYSIFRELCEYPKATRNDSLYNKCLRYLEITFLFKLFSGFIAISHELETVASMHGSNKSKIIRIPILINRDSFLEDDPSFNFEKPTIFHSGTMYERKDGIISTMKAFALASKQLNYSVDFVLAGPRSKDFDELEMIIKEQGLVNNVKYFGLLSHDDVIKCQKKAVLSILYKKDNLQNRCGFSTKLGEILLCKTALITTTIGEAKFYLKNNESAYIIEPDDINKLAETIVRVIINHEERALIVQNGSNVARRYFDCEIQGARLKRFLSDD